MGKCKPRTYTTLQILNWKFIIDLKPQQMWNFEKRNGKYRVSRNDVCMVLAESEFNKYFKEV